MNIIRKYKDMSFEQKTIINTIISLCVSAVLACGKLIIGLFTDYNMISIAVYSFGILLAKFECVMGVKTNKRSFRQRNILTALFLFISSVLYIGFMCRMFFIELRIKNNGFYYVLILAFISFVELGVAIAGLFRTKDKGHYYRNIRLINLCIALIAIMTTQMNILNWRSGFDIVHIANTYSGIGIGAFIALCAVYILIAPITNIIGREYNAFKLNIDSRNDLIDLKKDNMTITLCRSFIYGSYVYRAAIENGSIVRGNIERDRSLWKHMHIFWKIICCILSEILIFIWAAGRLLLFFRSINLPKRLEKIMNANGFIKIDM